MKVLEMTRLAPHMAPSFGSLSSGWTGSIWVHSVVDLFFQVLQNIRVLEHHKVVVRAFLESLEYTFLH